MSVNEYIVPINYVAEDNKTYINKASILFKDSNGFLNSGNEGMGYNFNRCPNDDDYNQPFIKGDKVYFQYVYDVKKYPFATPTIMNAQTCEEITITNSVTVQFGTDDLMNNYLNIIVDTSSDDFDGIVCWYLQTKMFKCAFDEYLDPDGFAAYTECVGIKKGEGLNDAEAKIACYNEVCDDFDYITSEPFSEIPCDRSVLVEGSYTKSDCNGNYYGALSSGASIFKLQVRVRGSVDPDGFDFAETLNNYRKVKSQQSERFVFYTKKIPYYVVRQLAACFNSQSLIIDSSEYQRATKLNKNFEEGSMWIVKENLFRDCSEINFSCE